MAHGTDTPNDRTPASGSERAFPLLPEIPTGADDVGAKSSRPDSRSSSSHRDLEKSGGLEDATGQETGDLERAATKEAADGGELVQKVSTTAPGGALHPDSYPDGGMEAWMAVLGGFCCLFVSFGWINAIGIFETVYETDILRQYSPSTIAWIVSMETFFMFLCGPIMGLVFDNYGPRLLLAAGTFLHVFGLMMASISTEYYQFLLAQGICSPLGASAVFYAAMSSVVTWFHRRRGLALGVMASGSSLGGVIFPIMVQNLIPRIGFPWAMRTAAFTILFMLTIANLTVKSRLPARPRRFRLADFVRPLAEPKFALLGLGSFLTFFGLFIPFTFLPLEAAAVGIAPEIVAYIIPILNAVSIFGRITPGYFSDKVGRYNMTIAMCALCGILVLALWLPAASTAPVIVFAALYGFASGAFVSLVPALVAAISPDMRQIGTRSGTVFAFISIGALCGNPIAGALINQDQGSFLTLKVFSGVFLCAGSFLIAVVRMIHVHGVLFTKV